MAEKLTPQQAQAVHDRGGKLLVSAAAGSGKTKVLVDRLLTYLTDPNDPANLDEFLIITYTKAAASELRGKIAAKLTERIAMEPENRHLQKQLQRLYLTDISTVHGFCSDLLREYAYRLDVDADFRVADESECSELMDTVLKDLLDRAYEEQGMDADFCAFVDSQGLGRDDRQLPELIVKVYNSARCHLNPEKWLDHCLESADGDACRDVSETVWGSFLMEELASYLDCQIDAFRACIQAAERLSGMEKVAANLSATAAQLENLRNCSTWDAVAAARKIDYGRLTFPKKSEDPLLNERIKAVRDACKDNLEKMLSFFTDDSRQVFADLSQCAAAARGLVALVRQFEKTYRQAKKTRRLLDFSDLEHKTLDLLLGTARSGPTAAAAEIGQRYREIMVDEYQDSNGVQDAIFSALTHKKQNCFMVGDVKQSIYQFRLADPGIFLEKYNRYAPAENASAGEGRKVLLSHNFRSGGEVIDGVNDVFTACMRPRVGGLWYGEAEALREGVPHAPLPDPGVELYALETSEDTYGEEAAFVAERIRQMLQTGTLIRDGETLRPVKAEDIVILLRSPGSTGGAFQNALESVGIRCNNGGGINLLQTGEIATLRSVLQTVANPRQDIPLISALASPVFGFTADDLAAIRAGRTRQSFYDALCASDHPKAAAFLKILEVLRREARMNPLTQLLERCFTLTRLDSIYGAMPGGEVKKANLQLFYQHAAAFENGSLRTLDQFLEHLDAAEEKGLPAAAAGTMGGVTLMSIHKSKGLEFPVVFLCGLSKKFNPESMRASILCDRELGLGMNVADNQSRIRYPSVSRRAIAAKMEAESVSEEMRVLYVAMTRARDRLIMTYASRYLEKELQKIALRMASDGGELLCRETNRPGTWVLLAAMGHTEAGELFAKAGVPGGGRIGRYPWKIRVVETAEKQQAVAELREEKPELPAWAEAEIRDSLAFRYAYTAATAAPSKQTATGRKGRDKDAEAAENTREPKNVTRTWRRPSFVSGKQDGKTYGSAMHSAMQFIRYENCGNEAAVRQEITRLTEEGFLTAEQGEMVNCGQITAFFQTPLGEKLRSGAEHLREFKFSILDDAVNYGDGLEGEQVLLQGVVDCALIEDGGITVLDFKTDHVTADTVAEAAERYRVQVQTYRDALSRIYKMPVRACWLYFFRLGIFAAV